MFRQDSEGDAAFRAEVRAWLEENLDDDLAGYTLRAPPEKLIPWHRKLYEKGWIAPHWPKEHGGMGASFSQQIIMVEELGRANAPPLCTVHGLNHLGPILIEFGTEEQRQTYLPPILRGDVIWAEGYSEPNSGSDLASLRTRAELDGDHWVVNGQKIWTTFGHIADWIFMLVRTDPDAPRKQAGIGFLLADMKTPGITARPITTIAGDDEFAEIFFEDVRVPKENMVGDPTNGWRIANAVLVHERLKTGHPRHCYSALERTRKVARATGAINDAGFRDRLARLEIDVTAYKALFDHAVELTKQAQATGTAASIMKIRSLDILLEIVDLLVEAAGSSGPIKHKFDTPEGPVDVTDLFLQSRHETIRGGTSQILRNVVAKRGLDMPT
jgi:hypothetical protein